LIFLVFRLATVSSQMKRVSLSSSAIAAVTYDGRQKTLEVEFRDGDIYRYTYVPKFIYEELLTAESAGAVWNRVKGNYKFTCVGVAQREL
jgi:hypothetical protein